MARYLISFNDNADSLIVESQTGGFHGAAAASMLWAFGDAVVAEISPLKNPGYAVDSVMQLDVQDPVPRPA